VKCQLIPLRVGKCIWYMAAILGHEGEMNPSTNTLQSHQTIVMPRPVWSNADISTAEILQLRLCIVLPCQCLTSRKALFSTLNRRYGGIPFQALLNACCHLCCFRNPSTNCIIYVNRLREMLCKRCDLCWSDGFTWYSPVHTFWPIFTPTCQKYS